MSIRSNWTIEELKSLYELPLLELISKAHHIHCQFHKPNEVQVCSLISIKTGGCPEDCKYCAQSSRYQTSVSAQPLMSYEAVINASKKAISLGASRICLGAAWRQVRDNQQFEEVLRMVKGICNLGVEVCCTLGLLNVSQAQRLKEAGLYAYNHNLDSSEQFYKTIITTRSYQDRLNTLDVVERADLSVCCGGILGMGEEVVDRLELLLTLCRRNPHPESIPINRLSQIPGTPLENQPKISSWELLRLIALARIILPASMVRLSCGRIEMSYEEQALCFLAGANSIHAGEKLLTTPNNLIDNDKKMFQLLGLTTQPPFVKTSKIEKRLAKRKQLGNFRQLQYNHAPIDFSSNDYLGLARSFQLTSYVLQEWKMHASPLTGSTGSRLLTGNSTYIQNLEDHIAAFHGYKTGVIFNCGYMANVGLLSTIADQDSVIFFDAKIHASTHDGIRLSRAKAFPFRHNDLDHLANRLKHSSSTDRFICIESIYSTDGTMAPLPQICELAEQYGAHLIVDEAHAVGVCGPKGRGLVAKHNLTNRIFAQIITFGKALGSHGAIILGNHTLKQAISNFATSYIYTTALPFHMVAAIKCSYDLFPDMEQEREQIQKLIQIFCKAYPSISSSHIQSIPIFGNETKINQLTKLGFDIRALKSPTVRQGEEVFRICLHAFNTEKDLNQLLQNLESRNCCA